MKRRNRLIIIFLLFVQFGFLKNCSLDFMGENKLLKNNVCCSCVDSRNTTKYNIITLRRYVIMANVNVRIDSKVKENAEAVFAKLGITPTMAISLFYNQVIRTNSIPFELKADVPNKKTRSAIKQVEKMEKNPEEYEGYDNIDNLMEDLLK